MFRRYFGERVTYTVDWVSLNTVLLRREATPKRWIVVYQIFNCKHLLANPFRRVYFIHVIVFFWCFRVSTVRVLNRNNQRQICAVKCYQKFNKHVVLFVNRRR